MRILAVAGAAALAMLGATAVLAAEHEVAMLNRGSDGGTMVFEPAFLKIAKGDTVNFVAKDKAHNAESVDGMIPEGAEAFKGKISTDISVTFDVEGAYGYKCLPHLPMGMVGLIVVGDNPANLDAIASVKVPPKARERFDALIEEAKK